MYSPDYLAFAPLYECNLDCPHCVLPRDWTERLDAAAGIELLQGAKNLGIREVCFTGGEPFLYPEFLYQVSREAAKLGVEFDGIITNGGWWQDEDQLRDVLSELKDSHYRGPCCLSVDRYHRGVSPAKRATFIIACLEVLGAGSISLGYTSPRPLAGMEEIEEVTQELSGTMQTDASGSGTIVFDSGKLAFGHNRLVPVGLASGLCEPTSADWFDDDCCWRGPGNTVYVNPRGDVKPCCGFSIQFEDMTIGNIYKDGLATIIDRGRKHPFVGFVFEHGLSEARRRLDAAGRNPVKSATGNCCYFCYQVLHARCWPSY